MNAEHPIIFSGEGVVSAILQGRKTQTRRVVKPQPDTRETEFWPDQDTDQWFGVCPKNPKTGGPTRGNSFRCRYGKPGDVLWVREGFRTASKTHLPDGHLLANYLADGQELEIDYSEVEMGRIKLGKSYPSIHMAKWACRIWLEVLNVRVERVRDISPEDVVAEGLDIGKAPYPKHSPHLRDFDVDFEVAFRDLWDKLNAKRGYPWSLNPWVWSILFRRIKHGKQREAQEVGS